MNPDYDQIIKSFIKEWENDPSRNTIKTAATGLIIPFVYKMIRENILLEKPVPLKGSSVPFYNRIIKAIHHIVWYLLWGLKWMLFLTSVKRNRKVVITSFFKNNNNIRSQLKLLNLKDQLFINFGVLYKTSLLLDRDFFCYPHAFYKKYIPFSTVEKDVISFKILFHNYFKSEFIYTTQLRKYLQALNSINSSFRKLLEIANKRNECVYLFQDCDYLAERVIFARTCSNLNIPSVVTDHSIHIMSHLFPDCHSHYAFVWGEHQAQRIKNFSTYQPKDIIIAGKPASKNSIKQKHSKTASMVYFLPPFQEPHMQTIQRNMEDTILRIREIEDYISRTNNKMRLLIKPHPSDDRGIFPFIKYLTYKSSYELADECYLAFTEDSTLTLELLKYEIPVIYIADRSDNDRLFLKNSGTDYIFCAHSEKLADKIVQVKKTDPNKRTLLYQYYFGSLKRVILN